MAALDFCRTFDKIFYNRLIALKLDHYDVRGNALNWTSAFLTSRSQCLELEGEASDTVN